MFRGFLLFCDEDLAADSFKVCLGKDATADELRWVGVGATGDDGGCGGRGESGEPAELVFGGGVEVERTFASQAFDDSFCDGSGISLGGGGCVGGVLLEGIGVPGGGTAEKRGGQDREEKRGSHVETYRQAHSV